jgi:TonB family protein
MRRNMRALPVLCTSIVLGVAVAIVPCNVQAASELEQHLRHQYNDKTLVLRNFYHGDRLSYDSAGSPVSGSAVSGDWTVDGFVRLTSLDLHGQRLAIQAERLSLGNTGQDFQFQQYFDKNKKKSKDEEDKAKKEHRLRIEVEFDASGITAEKADAALSRIFLTTQDRFADLVPDYWKPCVVAASTGKRGKEYNACAFPPEFASIPGIVYSSDEATKPDTSAGIDETNASEGPILRLGKGITVPKVISQKEPEFSEPARSAKYQGVVVLSIVVDKTGQVRNIRIWKPLGFGLDQKAVETVSKWQFNPGAKDGEPVALQLAVEVDFHLY